MTRDRAQGKMRRVRWKPYFCLNALGQASDKLGPSFFSSAEPIRCGAARMRGTGEPKAGPHSEIFERSRQTVSHRIKKGG